MKRITRHATMLESEVKTAYKCLGRSMFEPHDGENNTTFLSIWFGETESVISFHKFQ